jgi:hypothetical protein
MYTPDLTLETEEMKEWRASTASLYDELFEDDSIETRRMRYFEDDCTAYLAEMIGCKPIDIIMGWNTQLSQFWKHRTEARWKYLVHRVEQGY